MNNIIKIIVKDDKNKEILDINSPFKFFFLILYKLITEVIKPTMGEIETRIIKEIDINIS